jgi:hypothetical protein
MLTSRRLSSSTIILAVIMITSDYLLACGGVNVMQARGSRCVAGLTQVIVIVGDHFD